MKSIVMFGNSHVEAVSDSLRRGGTEMPDDVEVFAFNERVAFGGNGLFQKVDKKWILGNDVAAYLNELAQRSEIHVVSMIGGNAHNVLGLVEFPEPLDFFLPGREDIGIEEGASFVPYDLVEELVRSYAKNHLNSIRLMRQTMPYPMYHMESPPPMEETAHIVAHLLKDKAIRQDADLFRRVAEGKVTKPLVRYKLWKTNSNIFEKFCEENSIAFVSCPTEGMTENGFLLRAAYADDPTHGNHVYGSLLLKQIFGLVTG